MYIPVIFLNKQNKACLNKTNNGGGALRMKNLQKMEVDLQALL
jgi:hypothetical protein